MIPLETTKAFRKKDFLLLITSSLIFFTTLYLLNFIKTPNNFYIKLGTFYIILTLTLLLIRKTGTPTIYCLIISLIHNKYSLFHFLKFHQSLITLLIIGITFEAVIFTLRALRLIGRFSRAFREKSILLKPEGSTNLLRLRQVEKLTWQMKTKYVMHMYRVKHEIICFCTSSFFSWRLTRGLL